MPVELIQQVVLQDQHEEAFEDLDSELQKVLRVQLQKPGDVSAVVEMPGGFLVFFAKEKSPETVSASSLTVAKRSYEEWLAREPRARELKSIHVTGTNRRSRAAVPAAVQGPSAFTKRCRSMTAGGSGLL